MHPFRASSWSRAQVWCSETRRLTLQDYWNIVDEHFEARKRVIAVRKELSRAAQELRSVQKRLLVRFKDKNPMPLGNMDTLLETTYSRISDLSSTWEEEQVSASSTDRRRLPGSKASCLCFGV